MEATTLQLDKGHPIQRCPSDILVCIFEILVEDCMDSIDIATTISHVCHLWREVALSTPRLWARIEYNPIEHGNSELFRKRRLRMHRRIRNAPVLVSLTDTWSLGALRLNDFNHFEKLSLRNCPMDNERVANCFAPRCRLDKVELRYGLADLRQQQWPCNDLFKSLPHFRSLTLHGLPQITFRTGPSYPSLRFLKIVWVYELDLTALVSLFPRLEELEIGGNCVDDPVGDALVLTSLRTLKIDITDQYILKRLSCPNLDTFSIARSPVDVAIYFISKHPSIKTLRFWYLTHGAQLAAAAPQVIDLGITQILYENEPNIFTLPHFPHLRYLTFYDFGGQLTAVQFGKLVHERGIPSSHPRSYLSSSTTRLWSLKILSSKHVKVEEVEWTKTDLYRDAKRDVKRDEEFPLYTCYTFSWL